MTETIDILPGQWDAKIITRRRRRQECEVCGEPAHFKHTFLLPNARNNPDSAAHGRDDCSWSEDWSQFVCREHNGGHPSLDGYEWCATFPATAQFAHMFLYDHETVQELPLVETMPSTPAAPREPRHD